MKLSKNINKRIDLLEVAMAEGVVAGNLVEIECPLEHEFKDGYYKRTVTMYPGMYIVSKIHLSRHEFVISEGVVAVLVNSGKWKLLQAPYLGETLPGTRRILFIIEKTKWTTFHPLEPGETTPEQVEARIIKKHRHPFIEMKKELNNRLTNLSQLIENQ